jgi:hypothetical protein
MKTKLCIIIAGTAAIAIVGLAVHAHRSFERGVKVGDRMRAGEESCSHIMFNLKALSSAESGDPAEAIRWQKEIILMYVPHVHEYRVDPEATRRNPQLTENLDGLLRQTATYLSAHPSPDAAKYPEAMAILEKYEGDVQQGASTATNQPRGRG